MKKKPTQTVTIKFSIRIQPYDPVLACHLAEYLGDAVGKMLPPERRDELSTKLKGELADMRVKGVRK